MRLKRMNNKRKKASAHKSERVAIAQHEIILENCTLIDEKLCSSAKRRASTHTHTHTHQYNMYNIMQSIGHSVVNNSSQHELYSTNGYRFANVLNWFLSFVLWPSGRWLVTGECELKNSSCNAKSIATFIRINVKCIRRLQIHKIKYTIKYNMIGHEMPEDSHTHFLCLTSFASHFIRFEKKWNSIRFK